jgi:uncharacterized protein (DUF952 family)
MPIIFHVTTAIEWQAALQKGMYESASLPVEGFIHCSLAHQVEGVLERYFTDQNGLVKLVVETDKLNSQYVQEWSPSTQDIFPHIYGPININAVKEVIAL